MPEWPVESEQAGFVLLGRKHRRFVFSHKAHFILFVMRFNVPVNNF